MLTDENNKNLKIPRTQLTPIWRSTLQNKAEILIKTRGPIWVLGWFQEFVTIWQIVLKAGGLNTRKHANDGVFNMWQN